MLNLEVMGLETLANLDPETFTVRIIRKLVPVWRASIREFVAAAAESMAVDTGMSIASFRPLAADVRMKGRLESIISGKGIKRSVGGRYKSHTFPGPNSKKSAGLGERMGNNAYDIQFPDSVNDPQFSFTFNIVVLQHHLHENGLGKYNSHAFQSMDAGRTAFMAHWESRAAYIIESEIEGILL
jgi:hypothetical protein